MREVTDRTEWDEVRARRMAEPGAEEAYDATRRVFESGADVSTPTCDDESPEPSAD